MVRLIAKTEHSKVYLVRHKQLEVYRIAKVVAKNYVDYERILKEANIIKNFKHTGIPLVYDIEVDGDSICIIEEYIAGKSLAEFIAKEKLSVKQIALIGVRICEVLEYLHNYVGIVHMDIKPANIIVRNKVIKKADSDRKSQLSEIDISIIDYDSSLHSGDNFCESFGTVGYVAPERYSWWRRQSSSVKMDIYSMGMVLLYMLGEGNIQSVAESAGDLCELHSKTIGPIIRRCIRHNRCQRINSIEELKKELLVIADSKTDKIKDNTDQVRDIYVYGTRSGVGTTHFCLCLAAFLHRYLKSARKGNKVLYVRCGDRQDVFVEARKGRLEPCGAYMRHGIYIMPDYGGGISCDMSEYDVIVHDCGTDSSILKCSNKDDIGNAAFDKEQKRICICVDAHGYRKNALQNMQGQGEDNVIFINHISGRRFYEFVKQDGEKHKYYRMPCIYEWNETNRLFEEAVIEALGLEKRQRKV